MKTYFTFNLFWWKFHEISPQYKLNKAMSEKLWASINCEGKKQEIINKIERTNLTALEYLKLKLK